MATCEDCRSASWPVQRYGCWARLSAWVPAPPNDTTILRAASSVMNTFPPVSATTANGFSSATLIASARWEASSVPEAVTNVHSIWRP